MTLSIQLYSARNFPSLSDRLREIADLGYEDVEPYRGLYENLDILADGLAETGLTARSGHYSLELLEGDLAASLRIAERLGNEIVVLPYVMPADRPSDAAGWEAMAGRIASVARKVRDGGFRIAWHNHDFELRPLADGRCPLEIILDADPALEWEADLGWVVRGEADPVAWLKRYRGRVCALHVKDIAPAGEKSEEDGWADVGAGTLDWPALAAAGREAGAGLMIAEHDNPSDFNRFARVSIEAMRSFSEKV